MTWFSRENNILSLNSASLSALPFSVCVSPACFQTSMPLKWNCGSTVFALDLDPSAAQIVTRLTPEGFLLKPVFLPQHFTLTSKTNNQHLKLTDGSLESGWTAGSGYVMRQCFIRIQTEPHDGIERFPFAQPVFWAPNYTAWSICETDPLRLLLRAFRSFLCSAGWCHAAFSTGIQIWDIFTHRHANKSEKDCKCSWNMNMFKDTVKDAVVLSFAEVRPTFGPEEQYISGVGAYWLLKNKRFFTAELGFPLVFFRKSQGWTAWATGKPWESVRRKATSSPISFHDKPFDGVCPLWFQFKKMSNVSNTHSQTRTHWYSLTEDPRLTLWWWRGCTELVDVGVRCTEVVVVGVSCGSWMLSQSP